ncbi:glycoside hydrolase family 47 protein [Babjeviella inositovora NRRL Y-12698]|uniref:alpha-1,2-Mannosidase n=1 Tax=Babjeviella inositovora NRRL Y-12698 TaxID=984486 RepID=A0A1E3QYG2_9ASCO|nr:glycoside hydrolase family 47 protein [Babjeviella inositovora NRRL Y-12698]ODQ82634.1 glycoside hydrolase family 47 protein [Babjeviella inositovora NRRL Y-12698]
MIRLPFVSLAWAKFKRVRHVLILLFLLSLLFLLDLKHEEQEANLSGGDLLGVESVSGFIQGLLDKLPLAANQHSKEGHPEDAETPSENKPVKPKLPPLSNHDKIKASAKAEAVKPLVNPGDHGKYYAFEDMSAAAIDEDEGLPKKKKKPVAIHEFRYPLSQTVTFPLETDAAPAPEYKIQFDFPETSSNKTALTTIRKQFIKDWLTYKKYALGKDDVKPISQTFHNTFNGLGSTLIDSLDTLYLMGLHDEFLEMVALVSKIDFTKKLVADDSSGELRVFEINIRILGSLLSSFELSNEKRLLKKASEIGELLLKSFDTPNHFPNLYWNLKFHQQVEGRMTEIPSHHAALSELGTLSLEFIKLSQLTGDNRYMTVIDLIMKSFIAFDKKYNDGKKGLPGLFPTELNLNGCEAIISADGYEKLKTLPTYNDFSYQKLRNGGSGFNNVHYCMTSKNAGGYGSIAPSLPNALSYSTGGLADSFYEYLLKTYDLFRGKYPFALESDTLPAPSLNALVQLSFSSMKDFMIFRPALPRKNARYTDVLLMNEVTMYNTGRALRKVKKYKMNHLNCFMGGAFAIYGKIFHGPSFVDTGAGVTKGCLEVTNQIGIMPESFVVDACPAEGNCGFDYEKRIDWIKGHTESGYRSTKQLESAIDDEFETAPHKIPFSPLKDRPVKNSKAPEYQWTVGEVADQPLWISEMDALYALRPEIIESVFIMYRTTGDPYWREQGWWLYQKIIQSCLLQLSDESGLVISGIKDVTRIGLNQNTKANRIDLIESFWFSETLKYFYLLFADENKISLDDYVFNTEAHPFKKILI